MMLACLLAVLPLAATPPAPEASVPPAAPAPAADVAPALASTVAPTLDPAVDDLLTRLESAANDLRDFSAGIAYERFDALLEETERRFGRLVVDGQGKERKLALLFDEFIDGSGRADRTRDHWLFLDGWLIEINEKSKTVFERQVAPPGSTFDPLKLGEGPFPIPLGQPKAEVLKQFAVEAIGTSDAPLLKSLPPGHGLRLVPREETDFAKETAAIEAWYEPETLSPLGLVIRQRNGDSLAVRLVKPVRNGGLSEADRGLLARPAVDPTQWSIDRRPLAENPG
jgi:hypothetical protein